MQKAINISEESYKNIKEQVDKRDYPDMQIGRAIVDGVLIPQEPILDKIRAEIQALSPEPTAYDVVDGNPIKDAVWETIADVLKIIDKYKTESDE